jgi:non-ribosomal peptide synthase protein (TIGR01720 family)
MAKAWHRPNSSSNDNAHMLTAPFAAPMFEVAIIGMAGRFPGASNLDEFWRNLRDGVESVSCSSDGHDSALLSAGQKHQTRGRHVNATGVLAQSEYFDATLFGFSPREAEATDPQQRVFLECAWEALEDAGYNTDNAQETIGVFAGAGAGGYLLNIYSNPDAKGLLDPFHMAYGNDKDYLSTRVCYKLNLRGPGVTIQTACSTSLVAVHMACQNLLTGACDLALAGGVAVCATQTHGYFYLEGGILSPDGHTRAFDARARGCVPGNGVGIVVLKRLKDALADGDTIHAIIKGSAVNNDGSIKVGYTAPSIEGQAAVIRAAQKIADIDPNTISYIEAHGTGTPLGDPAEIAALIQAFGAENQQQRYCAIGSLKTNVGHLDAAAGVGGLIKTVLALKHKQIPPSLNFEFPNPHIHFETSPFYVNTALSEWRTDGSPRRAGVSSFGIGGTNAHVVVQEAPARKPSGDSRSWKLLLLSAKTESALTSMRSRLADFLEQHPETDLADAAFTLQVGRRTLPFRNAIRTTATPDAISVLRTPAQKRPKHLTRGQSRATVFLLPGQGTQYVGMGRELYETETVFRYHLDWCCDVLKADLGLDLRSILFPLPAGEKLARQQLQRTLLTQAALFVVEYATAKLWMHWGIVPDAMIGHSIGEYAAACIADVFSLSDALMLVAARGRLMSETGAGAMLAVFLPEESVSPLLVGRDLSLAAVNAPSLSVVSGAEGAVEEFARQLENLGVASKRLKIAYAFHSEMMETVLPQFLEEVRKITLRPPSVPFISNVTGTWITPDDATNPQYWARHLRQTVRFSDGLKSLLDEGYCRFLEVGPGRELGALLRRQPEVEAGALILNSMDSVQCGESEMASMLDSLGQLWVHGARVNWSAFYEHEKRQRVPLPTYPFERKRYWVEPGRVSLEVDSPGSPTREFQEIGSSRDTADESNERHQHADPQTVAPRPESSHSRPDLDVAYVAPRNEIEQTLAQIWQQQLGIEAIGVHDNFFQLGGDSVISIQIVAKARQAGVALSPKHLFECATIAELAKVAGHASTIAAEQAMVSGPVALTPIQSWFFELQLVESSHFNQATLLAAIEKIDCRALKSAVEQVIRHHDTLRLRFTHDGKSWQQCCTDDQPEVEIVKIDLTGVSGDRDGFITAKAEELQASLNFTQGPVLRIAVFEAGENGPHRLLIVIHHLVIDALSWRILLEDLQQAYRSFIENWEIQLPAKTTSFQRWAERLQEHSASSALASEIDYWANPLRNSVKPLPRDFERGENLCSTGQVFRASLRAEETRTLLTEVPQVYNTQINDSMLAALALATTAWTGEHSILVDLEGHGREEIAPDTDVSRTVGWFTTIYPVLLFIEEDRSPGTVLKQVKEQLRKLPNNGIGYGLLRYGNSPTQLKQALRSQPAAEMNFLYLGQLDPIQNEAALFELAPESPGATRSPKGRRPYLLEISAMVIGGELRTSWVYSENFHDRRTIEGLAHEFLKALRDIIAHCQSPSAGGYTPSDFPLAGLDEGDLQEVLSHISFEAN